MSGKHRKLTPYRRPIHAQLRSLAGHLLEKSLGNEAADVDQKYVEQKKNYIIAFRWSRPSLGALIIES